MPGRTMIKEAAQGCAARLRIPTNDKEQLEGQAAPTVVQGEGKPNASVTTAEMGAREMFRMGSQT